MMAREETRKTDAVWLRRASPGRQRYRFVFDLESRDTFGDSFECEARDQRSAFDILNSIFPGADHYVKTVEVVH